MNWGRNIKHVNVHDRWAMGMIIGHLFVFWIVVGFMMVFTDHFNEPLFNRLVHWPLNGERNWQSPLATWDAAHYLNIATHGYVSGADSCAFYPLWPFLIQTYAFLCGGDLFLWGLILANILSCLVLYAGYRLCNQIQGQGQGLGWLVWILCLPGSNFLHLIYTESLFMLLTIGIFSFLEKRRYGFAAALAFFLPLTKAIGIFIVFPILFYLVSRKETWKHYLSLLFPGFGYATYFLIIYFWTGNFFEGFEAQKNFPTQPSILRLFDIVGFVDSFLSIHWTHNSVYSWLDRLFFVFFWLSLPLMWKRNRNVAIFCGLVGLISVTSTLFISFTRHFVTCFPGVMPGKWSIPSGWQGLFGVLFMLLLTFGKFWLIFRYINFHWAG